MSNGVWEIAAKCGILIMPDETEMPHWTSEPCLQEFNDGRFGVKRINRGQREPDKLI
jgi:hypothetical protein